ncbi:MAG: hypothetical protein E6K80_10040 [Candidatus Eisenbacteria bacterium]|uniref:Polyamine aminopropyltransferase n=1 Tax=Eiseniibacteriota bacterium TaxID=2212470 RepID=A0A538U225_UNCEI|nr:MAG: hypothetical protein E6K80_10040 [Candidatus Eisenbacteria bacterium]
MSGSLWLYVVVALSGAGVLALEILGTRLLGPFYGVSLYLWSALISVTHAALSVGYALGGRWADRDLRAARLPWLLTGAGLWIMVVPWMREPLLAATEHLGLRAAVLLTATVLFFPPLALLGMVSPIAIRIHASGLERVGRSAGNLYAVSTMASVAAALITGFWLIPTVGVQRLTIGTGLMLLIAALVAWLVGEPARARALTTWTLLIPGAFGIWNVARDEPLPPHVRSRIDSPYAEIRVVDHHGLRYFMIDGGIHTIVRPGTPESHHAYVHVGELANELFSKPGRMLLIGLGGGAVARTFTRDGWQVDAVEIDPQVVRTARDWFELMPTTATVHVEDGRRFLRRAAERWDVIFLDAFGSSAIPFHLITREAFALARSRLARGGVLVVNVEAVGWDDELVKSVGRTLGAEFSQVLALPIAEPPDKLGNLILLASDRPLEISDAALGNPADYIADDYLHWTVVLRNHAWENRFVPGRTGGQVLTDDLDPVDVWAERINLAARVDLHRFFGRETATW